MNVFSLSKKSTLLQKIRSFNSPRRQRRSSSDSQTRVAVLGASKVGKTAIIRQLSRGHFTFDYQETIEDLYKESIGKDPVFEMDILDTSGNLEYSYFRSKAIRKYDIFVLVFSLTDKSSFHAIKDIRNEIIAKRKKSPIIVVGNKADDGKRFNRREVLQAIVNLWGHSYMECSAKSNNDVKSVFKEVANLSEGVEKQSDRDVGGVNDGSIFIRIVCDGKIEWKRLW
ncbi:hypothetical protein FSP39_001903 [Pinctada imbricata]|uniref:Uncharacterized protein n=1 Tax=Pinctada imbricata TaxID=66713 RepID=A0AA88YJM5_PINIB|nr:hypothetical protein FSP39_001903 [Pinctada imbricata]